MLKTLIAGAAFALLTALPAFAACTEISSKTIALTGCIYVAFRFLARDVPLTRRIWVGLSASLLAAAAQAGLLISADRFLEKPQEEMRFVSREGYTVIETGNTMRLERPGQEALVMTWPRLAQLHGRDVFRYAADSTVTWFFFFAAL